MTTTMTMYGKAGADVLGGETGNATRTAIDWLNDTIKVSLHTTTYAPNVNLNRYYSDLSNELTTALGYTSGGATLGSKVATYATGTTVFTAANPSWTAAGGTLIFRYAVVRKDSGTGTTSPLIGYLDFGTQNITDGNPVTIVWDATNGVFKAVAI